MKAKGSIKIKGASVPLLSEKLKDVEVEISYDVEYNMSDMKEAIELIDTLHERMDKLQDIYTKLEEMDGLVKIDINIKE